MYVAVRICAACSLTMMYNTLTHTPTPTPAPIYTPTLSLSLSLSLYCIRIYIYIQLFINLRFKHSRLVGRRSESTDREGRNVVINVEKDFQCHCLPPQQQPNGRDQFWASVAQNFRDDILQSVRWQAWHRYVVFLYVRARAQ